MRVKLSKKNLKILFDKVFKVNDNRQSIFAEYNVSTRTLNNWRQAETTIPVDIFKKLINVARVHQDSLSPKFIPDFWHIKNAASKGGKARMKLYGNFGTPEGRRKGGKNSLVTHQVRKNGFVLLKSITKPVNSRKLAEFMGIMAGDGHLSHYQAIVTTNSRDDFEYAIFVQKMFKNLFCIFASLKKKPGENTLNVVASSKNMVYFIHKRGMPIGNKIKKSISVPKWIFRNISYQQAFIRGLLDTDGCVFLDTHKINGKKYKHLGLAITIYAEKLRDDVLKILKALNFSPTYRVTQKSIYIRKQAEVGRYFKEIGTSNSKHFKRYNKFLEEYRSGHNGAVSKTAVPA